MNKQQYNLENIQNFKYGLIGFYFIKLNQIQETGKVPSGFDIFYSLACKALKSIPDKDRQELREIINLGYAQAEFIKTRDSYNSLKINKKQRESKIERFLKNLKEKEPELFELKI